MCRPAILVALWSLSHVAFALEPNPSAGKTPAYGRLNPEAPPETRQFGQLAGKWDCTTASLQEDGSWRESRAEWTWFYILDGFAVQDTYVAPQVPFLDRPLHGTNVRAYDPQAKQWTVVWLQNASNTFESPYRAVADGSNIIMTGQRRGGPGKFRVTFHNITEGSFDWLSEDEQADGSWKATFRIQAKRVQ